MFDHRAAWETFKESDDSLTRDELEERRALIREFVEWIDEREAIFRAALESAEAGK